MCACLQMCMKSLTNKLCGVTLLMDYVKYAHLPLPYIDNK